MSWGWAMFLVVAPPPPPRQTDDLLLIQMSGGWAMFLIVAPPPPQTTTKLLAASSSSSSGRAAAAFDQLLLLRARAKGAGGAAAALAGACAIKVCRKFWANVIWRTRIQVSCGSGVVRWSRSNMDSGSDKEAVVEGASLKASTSSENDRWKDAISRARFGKPIIVEPRAEHLASIVWLHGLGDNGFSWASILEMLPLPNVRWIVPTAPVRPVAINGGFPCTAWFDVADLSEDGPDDLKGLDLSTAFVANLLSKEPPEIKLAVGGFSQGAATALFAVTRSVIGKYSDGTPFPLMIDSAVGLSGWLPSSKSIRSQEVNSNEFARLAAELPIFLAHGTRDYIVSFKFGEMSAQLLQKVGFSKTIFRPYKGMDHSTTPQELDEVCNWLREVLELQS
ncbi:hypothetical protein O6H91_07G007300 [Diphasiastrum complanatum]|uniref:Uncharacterized protein n=1 Tax=Diphasiastrum complanatum TaxID=34168 RepID=A0ACC2D287_DIPCM|nr:hypothetical protein O6H91_07G007300 [Diphasiastrum complanatum]